MGGELGQLRLSRAIQELLRCPVCGSGLELLGSQLRCSNAPCAAVFPVTSGVPVLINEASSIFSIADIVHRRKTFFPPSRHGKVWPSLKGLVPDISRNVRSRRNYTKFARLLLDRSASPKVLVLGGGVLGQGVETFLQHSPTIEVIETDVSFGPRTMLICDAHDIPFRDATFDGVIVQAVLEHVVDPYRCVDEIHRALKKDGLVYAEAAFMQQVHGGPYDFTRFTHLGLRRLFRKFEELDSGAVCGPGMALAWAYQYFLLSFAESRSARTLITLLSRLTSFYLKYFDYYLVHRKPALDAASGYYFMGRKTSRTLPDAELMALHRGAVS